ncbi:hypothetical protein ACWEJ6_44335 [Nonomuraea sp. NPDC004702]
MAIVWSREEIVEAVRTYLLRSGAITDGFSAAEVVAEPDNLLVTFHWRRDPNVYAVEVRFPTAPISPWTGLPVTSADEWAAEALSSLAEELATGLVSRSRRKVRDGYVVLDARNAPDVSPPGFHLSPVPLVGAPSLPRRLRRRGTYVTWGSSEELVPLPASETGTWLAEAGMDVRVPHRLIAEDRLACWLQAYVNNDSGHPDVGHAVASWEDTRHTIARLDLVYIQPGVPTEVRGALARLAVRMVTEDGALHVVTALDLPELHELGFRPTTAGELTFDTIDPAPGTAH